MKARTSEVTSSAGKRRGRLLGKKILLLACATIVGLILGEILLRFAGISFPQLHAPDPHCASRLRAGASGWWITEGRAFVKISSDGLRDKEHSVEKPADVVRIAVLGDSYSEALQVDVQDAYWAVAERELRRSQQFADRKLEFINFGVSGYGTAQELLMLRNYVWKYEPDVVILAFCHNDIQDNSRELGGGDTRPYFVLQDDELRLDDSFLKSAGYLTAQTRYEQTKARVVNCSYLLQVLKHAKLLWQQRHERAKVSERGLEDIGSEFNVYEPPRTEAGRSAWEVTERLIAEIHADVVRRKAKFGLMTVSTPLQAYPDPEVRNAAGKNGASWHLLYTENRLAQLAERRDFPILTLATPLREYAESENVCLHGFPNTKLGTGHWNEIGHKVAGQNVARWLGDELLK